MYILLNIKIESHISKQRMSCNLVSQSDPVTFVSLSKYPEFEISNVENGITIHETIK